MTGTCVPPTLLLNAIVFVLMVISSIASLKLIVTVVLTLTPEAPAAGVTPVIVGGLVSCT